MTHGSLVLPEIFLLKIELPANLIMTRLAVATATQIADTLSLNSKQKYALEVSLEEAFSNAVQHFSKETLTNEKIYLEYSIKDSFLVISIRENGIPFNINEAELFSPDTLENMEKSGLGTFLIEQMMDSVEYFVHGRDGKEMLLKKKIALAAIPEEFIPSEAKKKNKKRKLVKHSICREATAADLPEICRLAWKCYGYTQEELLYNIDLLTEKFNNGEIKPIIFHDPESSNMIAHEALKYHDPSVRVPELGLAFIDPAYRCPKLTRRFADEALRISAANGDKGIFDCSVTTHIFSQKAIQEYLLSSPCSIMFAIAASGMNAEELSTTRQEKGTTINHYHAFDKSSHTIFITEQHKEIIKKIYNWMELPREYGEPAAAEPNGQSLVITFPLPDELNVSFIIVNKIGAETVNEIQQALKGCKAERKDAVYIFIPTGVEHSPYIVDKCEELGFSFAGIMPHIHNGDDRILMQYIDITLDYTKIKVYGKKSAELLSYTISELERVNNN